MNSSRLDYKGTYVTGCGGIHQSGSHSQRSTVQGIEDAALDEKLSLFAHPQESIDLWDLGEFRDLPPGPPPPYTNEASNNDFLTSSALPPDSKWAPVVSTSIGTTGAVPLPYGLCKSTDAPNYWDAFVLEPNLKRNQAPDSMSQKIVHSHPQKQKTSVDSVLFCNRGKNARPVGSEKTTAAAEKRRSAQATLRCPLYVNGCNAIFTTRHNRQYHVNSHYGYKPYHCRKGCPYKASSPSTMKRHEKKCGVQQG
ncbi:hypothetical protein M378DRAFT_464005 [Amanita muscaria Koide BX008]|uniref:C2H2-type domain-containing protein n=1 Tax=Amanita muscaria (strain Koide BX008) TaxID=946122 RepID=A0A0C2XAF7_AMAMK|nr:hypothetical protein M378DRAFT_464005 [Amanita muscaria Koide BX008]